MSKPIRITGYIIVNLESQLSPAEAVAELFDNSVTENATEIVLSISRGSMSITDNGDGTDDPNLIITPSASLSRFKKAAIGSKAIGAKQACATFGRTWEVETVPRGKNEYHRHKITWHPDGPLPPQYEGPHKLARFAPIAIRNGGTRITVTNRQPGFQSLRLERLCEVIEERYRPCLNSGTLRIIVQNPESGFNRHLRNAAFDTKLFEQPIREIDCVAGDRKFTIRFGVLREAHRALSYCHFIFGPRVIMNESRIGKHALPAGCYIDVILGDEWKTCLSTNKTSIVRYFDELTTALERELGDWILQQKDKAAAFKIRMLCGELSSLMNNSISLLDEDTQGASKAAERTVVVTPPGPGPGPDPEPPDDDEIPAPDPRRKRRKRAIQNGEFGSKPKPRKCARLKIEADEKLLHKLFTSSFDGSDEVTIRLNTGPHQREVAEYFQRGKIDDLYPIAVVAFGMLVGENPKQFRSLFSGLRKRGYAIDESDHKSDITTTVSNFMLDAAFGQRGSIKRKIAV